MVLLGDSRTAELLLGLGLVLQLPPHQHARLQEKHPQQQEEQVVVVEVLLWQRQEGVSLGARVARLGAAVRLLQLLLLLRLLNRVQGVAARACMLSLQGWQGWPSLEGLARS